MNVRRVGQLDVGIGLISLAVLLIELLLTRIFSVTLFYHLSFMVVSIAMLGLGAGGLVVHLWPGRFDRERLGRTLAGGCVLFAMTSVAAVAVALNVSVSLDVPWREVPQLALIYAVSVVPFLAAGVVIALILSARPERANRLYFFDLAGAALACVLFIPLTNWLGAPSAVLAAASVATAAAVVFAGGIQLRLAALAAVLCVGLIGATWANARHGVFDVRSVKGAQQPPTLALAWNSFSRVEVVGMPTDLAVRAAHTYWGYSPRIKSAQVPSATELPLLYDASAQTNIVRFDGDAKSLTMFDYDISSAPYKTRPCPRVLVIGAGGGRDVLNALYHGATHVTGVEVNPLTVSLMRGQFRDFTGGLYDGYPGVEVVVDEGRSFLRDPRRGPYDLIQATLVDTWAATAAGAFALTENNLYTVEAFECYLDHLSDEGLVAFSRWYHPNPVEALRVVSLAAEALRRRGVADPAAHVAVVLTPLGSGRHGLCTVLVKRTPFSAGELDSLRGWAAEMQFLIAYAPGVASDHANPDFAKLLGPDHAAFVARYPYVITPVYDDRPFFFDRVPLMSWIGHRLGVPVSPAGAGELTLGGRALLACLAVSAACTLGLLLLPALPRLQRRRMRTERGAMVAPWRATAHAVYFAGLGLGFITVEILLLQRFNLFFGYPVYSLAVVLFTILLSSAAGSYWSGRWDGGVALPRVLALLCAGIVLYAFALHPALNALHAQSLAVRIGTSVAVLTPLGLLMGVPFPTGLRRAAEESPHLVPWAWAVNGVASVFGTSLAMLMSMTFGFTVTMLGAAACYALSLAIVLRLGASPTATAVAAPLDRVDAAVV